MLNLTLGRLSHVTERVTVRPSTLFSDKMESPAFRNLSDRRVATSSKSPATTKWFREWVPQDVVATGGKCLLLKWVNEATLKALKETKEREVAKPEPEPATDVLFLCSYEGCGKTFIDAGALRKHSHIHGERQYVCHYENCGRKFLDSSKLKRHFLIHTGERKYMCPHEGCGKAFSLDFNLKSHMKTHSQENYHICPYTECGKRFAHEYKLKNHIASAHHKMTTPDAPKLIQPAEKPPTKKAKSSANHAAAASSSSDRRPYTCPYEGCDKAYIHEYKLNLHLRKEHPTHFVDEDAAKNPQLTPEEQRSTKRKTVKAHKQNGPNLTLPPPVKAQRQSATSSPASYLNLVKQPWRAFRDDDEETEMED